MSLKEILKKIEDEDVQVVVTKILDELDAVKAELEVSRETANKLVEDNQRLRNINTELYANSLGENKDVKRDEPEEKVEPLSLEDALDEVINEIKK